MNIGYLRIRATDAIRYPIYFEHNKYYFKYAPNIRYNINLPLNYHNLNYLDIVINFEHYQYFDIVLDQHTNYVDFLTECQKQSMLEYIYINEIKTKNNNIITFNPLQLNTNN